MYSIFYIIGVVVVVLAILSFLGIALAATPWGSPPPHPSPGRASEGCAFSVCARRC